MPNVSASPRVVSTVSTARSVGKSALQMPPLIGRDMNLALVFVSMLALTQRWCAPAEDEAPVKLAVISSILLIISPK